MQQASPTRSGLTLIELVVVVALMSVLAVTASQLVRLPLRNAKRDQSLAQLRWLESTARDRARRFSSVNLCVEVSTGRLWLQGLDRDADSLRMALPESVGEMQTLGMIKSTGDGSQDGRFVACYDRFGTTKTFAIGVKDGSNREKWLLFLGLTGQVYEFDRRETAERFVRAERHHPG